MAGWPGGARGALCLSFDNLGEAAAIELGAIAADDPSVGEHPTVTQALPSLLEMLGEHELVATFFVEGLNAELYPDALKTIAARGHEVAYHAWRHEQWGDLSAGEQATNLARGIEAFGKLSLEIAGMRPPGGQLGRGGLDVLREAGLRYCSPVDEEAGVKDGLALLPFRWRHVDASCVLPPLAVAREEISGAPDPIEPDAFLTYLSTEIERLVMERDFATIVLHPFMLEWFGEDRLGSLFNRLDAVRRGGELWLATCADVAEHVLP